MAVVKCNVSHVICDLLRVSFRTVTIVLRHIWMIFI